MQLLEPFYWPHIEALGVVLSTAAVCGLVLRGLRLLLLLFAPRDSQLVAKVQSGGRADEKQPKELRNRGDALVEDEEGAKDGGEEPYLLVGFLNVFELKTFGKLVF